MIKKLLTVSVAVVISFSFMYGYAQDDASSAKNEAYTDAQENIASQVTNADNAMD